MFYAVYLCGNPGHERYQRPLGFITSGEEGEEIPLECETEKEIREKLRGHGLYDAGWVEIIEIDC